MVISSWSRTLVWLLVTAAFIGPGTVTTATRAGSEGGIYYLGLVLLAALAGITLLEMVARITLVSGRPLGQALEYLPGGRWLSWSCFAAVLLGCMAYQAGNLLGALEGIRLLYPLSRAYVLFPALLALGILWSGEKHRIANVLGVVVALLGFAFVVVALGLILGGAPLQGRGQISSSAIIGLIGTTIVPYNFFLAAGLGRGQQLSEMRRGLWLSFGIGTLITASVVLAGSELVMFTDFTDLAGTLDARLGGRGAGLLGTGLFAAGFSSAVTAPLAAALAGRELLGSANRAAFAPRALPFRTIWLLVLSTGTAVALLKWNSLAVIFAAQVANGLLLPGVAALVLLLANRPQLLGKAINTRWQNAAGFLLALFLAGQNAHFLCGKAGWTTASLPITLTIIYGILLSWGIRKMRSGGGLE